MGSATLWANVALPFCPKRSTCVLFTAGLQSQMFQGIITGGSQNMSIQRGDGSFGMFEDMRLTGGGTIEAL
ncbi:hypothetical protein [Bosea sp. UNC402CLCol]|uniref:hypothetical protein n=1 Tax=Bosea sp. UNC402CLCol TaxID=1510531 RepID=UPI0012E092E2|nr:hypothetical protein [Bosea sp. UNC402CLCol]